MTTTDAPVTVEQCDRDRAAEYGSRALGWNRSIVDAIVSGRADIALLVQAFAHCRFAALASAPAAIDYESALFDVLETLKAHYPHIASGFARGTGGFDRDYILDELQKPASATAESRKNTNAKSPADTVDDYQQPSTLPDVQAPGEPMQMFLGADGREAIARALYLRRNPSDYSTNDSYQWRLAKSHVAGVEECFADADAVIAALARPRAAVGE